VNVQGSQGIQVGDGNVQQNTFMPPEAPPEPGQGGRGGAQAAAVEAALARSAEAAAGAEAVTAAEVGAVRVVVAGFRAAARGAKAGPGWSALRTRSPTMMSRASLSFFLDSRSRAGRARWPGSVSPYRNAAFGHMITGPIGRLGEASRAWRPRSANARCR
jgi:hypothetical protein